MLFLLLFTSIVSEQETQPEYKRNLICEDISETIKNKNVACEIEKVLRINGFGAELIVAALTNSYAESKFNPLAIGDQGMSVGVFQLRTGGLGGTMTVEERQDIKKSTERVVIALKKSTKIKNAIARNSTSGQLTKLFCTEIMRPSDKHTKAQQRALLVEIIFD